MFGVALHLPLNETQLRQWEYVLCHFRPDEVYLVGSERPEGIAYRRATLIRDSNDLPADVPIVLMAPQSGRVIPGNESLDTFCHPDDAIYWFGPDTSEHMNDAYLPRRADCKVYIPTDTVDQMFAHVACAVTLWDRRRFGIDAG